MRFKRAILSLISGALITFSHSFTFAQIDFWEQIGGPTAIALAINSDDHIFAGSLGAGVVRSLDDGASWAIVDTGLINSFVFHLAINSRNHIFAGTYGSGVFRSLDNGNNWTTTHNGTDLFVTALTINSQGHIFVAISRLSGNGVFRSADNGENWTPINDGLMNLTIRAFVTNSLGDIYAGADSGYVFRSLDNGDNWVVVGSGIAESAVVSFAINTKNQIFAATQNSGLLRSSDNGNTWINVSNNSFSSVKAVVINSNGDVYVGTEFSGVFRSIDNGDEWEQMNDGLTYTPVYSLAIDSRGRILAGTLGDVHRSVQSTTTVSEGPASGKTLLSFVLHQNYPNPFNPSTKIVFSLPTAQPVTLTVFDLAGREVAVLLQNEIKTAGTHEIIFDAGDLPSGVYVYKLTGRKASASAAQPFVATRKMLLVR